MKKLKLFFACLLMAVLSIGQVWAETVEFTPSNCTNWTSSSANQSQTIDGITISSTAAANNTQLRLYSGGTHTFTSTVGNITKIEFTCTASGTNSNGPGKMSLASGSAGSYSYSGTLGTWTGDAATCALYNGQSRCTKIVVTYTPSGSGSGKENLTDEQLSWSAASANITFGDEPYSLPSLTNSIPVSVTYESTAEAVATISNVGVVSVLKAGSTTIKAIFAGNDDYNAKTVSYTLTVAPAPLTPIVGGVIDVLNSTWSTITGTSYSDLDKNAPTSDAHYKGSIAGQNNTIQLRASNNSGIVSTISGGKVKRIEVLWNSGTAVDRQLDIYGKNTAYTASSDLYNSSTRGTSLGNIKNGTSTYIDIEDDYEYIGFRSSSNAMYFDEIRITWIPAPEYAINIASVTGGTLVVKDGDDPITSGDKFKKDKELTVNVTPDETHTGGEIVVTKTEGGDNVTASVLSGTTLTVPDYDITVSASFTPTYSLEAATVTGGTFSWTDEDSNVEPARVIAGTLIQASNSPAATHNFASYDIYKKGDTETKVSHTDGLFEMPAYDVVISGTFTQKPCTQLGTPANVVVSGTSYPYNTAALNWDDVDNADHYEVVIKKAGAEVESDIVDESEYSFSTTLLANTTYTYEIIATSDDATTYCASEAASADFATADYPSVTVTYSENGNTDNQVSKKIFTPFNLPDNAAGCSKTFVGWTTKDDFADGDESLASYHAKGTEFTIESNADITLYAVYATATPGTPNFSLSNAAPADGDQVIIARLVSETYYAMENAAGSSVETSALTVSAGVVSEPADDVIWDVEEATSGVFLRPTGETGSSLHLNNSALKVANGDTNGDMVFSANGNGSFKVARAANDRWISASGTNGVSYTSSESSAAELYIFKYGAGVSYSDYAIVCTEQLAEPEFTVEEGTYYEAKTIGITATNDADIYYTLDGSAPTKTTGTKYTAAILLSERAITTIKAIAVKEGFENSNVAEAEYNINLPYDFADFAALTKENNKEYAVRGIISQKGTLTANNQLPYYISADGFTDGQIKCHNGLGLNKATFTSADDVNLGDNVTVVGTWSTQYNNINANNWMLEYTARVHDSYKIVGNLTATSFNDGDAFDDAILANLSVHDVFTNNYEEAVAGATLDCGDKTAWHDGETKLTVYAKLAETPLTSKDFDVTVSSATLVSIALKADDAGYQTKTVYYLGDAFVAPTIVATLSDANTIEAVATYVSGFDNANAGVQEITVSYTRGAITEQTSYNITMKKVFDNEDDPHTVAVANALITAKGSGTESTEFMWVHGIVSSQTQYNSSYYISDDGTTSNELYVFSGKYFDNESFTADTKLHVGDEVIVKAKIQIYSAKNELTSSVVTYQLREGELDIDDVAEFEVKSADLAEADLTIERNGSDGAITFASGNTDVLTIVENKLHAVAAGDVEVTATMAATAKTGEINFTEATKTFSVHVIAEQVKYAISFDGNGADGGSAPEAIADKAAGASVPLPANTYTYTGHNFAGWKVINNSTSTEVSYTGNSFTMPASAVTIQAQWEEISTWAYVYSNNVAVTHANSGANGTITIGTDDPYALEKAGSKNNTGTIKVTVPAGATDLHFHAFAWGGQTAKIQISGVTNPSVSEFDLAGEAGASGNGNDFTLQGDPVDQYFHVSFDAVAAETEITFSKATGSADNRFFFYGVNQEGGDFGYYQRSGLTAGNYATICLPNGGTISGATLFDLDYYDGANTLYLLEVNGNAMEAGHPYIFLPSETSIEVTYTNNFNASAGSFNGLVGSYTVESITPDGSNYILLNNQYYRVVTDARVGANRAYIHMASVPTTPSQQQGAPRRRVAMTVNGENAAQGFENIESGDKPMKVMIEGTMYILRGEKVYDATGRLVK